MRETIGVGAVAPARLRLLAVAVAVIATVAALAPSVRAASMLLGGQLQLDASVPDALFARVALAQSVIPVGCAVLLGACALIPARAMRAAAAIVAAVLCMLAFRLIMLEMAPPVPQETVWLVPAVVYLIGSRRPAWWVSAALAIAPIAVVLDTSFYA